MLSTLHAHCAAVTFTKVNLALKTIKLQNNSLLAQFFTNLFYMVSSISHTELQVQVLWQLV